MSGKTQMDPEASGQRMTRALQQDFENHQKLLEILRQEVRCGAPQNAGSGLNGAVSFGPKTKSDGQCANDRSISKTKASLPEMQDD
jgi:hypothetical protein